MPLFTVANEKGQPLNYEVNGKDVAIFYADVEQAKEELKASVEQFPTMGCDLIPVGLGGAYQAVCEGKAVLVPGLAELTAAGLPEGAPTMGQPLPLFACMEMSREGPDGTPILPLFLAHSDCKAAVDQATSTDLKEGDEQLEIVGLSLPSVVERLSKVADETPAFQFVAPSASAAHIRDYLGTQG